MDLKKNASNIASHSYALKDKKKFERRLAIFPIRVIAFGAT
jgi:hypothetical protein